MKRNHERAVSERPAAVRAYVAFAPISLLATVPAQRVGGSVRDLFVKEDSLVEMSTAAFFLLAFVLSLALQAGTRARRLILLALGTVGLAGFLDELSFGQRIFRFTTPKIGRLNLDGFHDLIQITQHSWRDGDFTVRAVLLAAVATIGVIGWRLWRRHRSALTAWWHEHRRHPATFLVLAAVAQVGLAMTVDLHFVRFAGISLLEEMLEFNGALALALAVWFAGRAPLASTPRGEMARTLAT